ncbi:hypothetical protein BGZ70_009775 [Mortierella alpina]|uniref:Mtf2-like C-terminal domain-containing protein n=1 Tax=Mortierella alpina TaxID=64518 RepID=A0A9P6JDG3_MORAP|nr:hypothetical protein BGZ70_009775 [Mortierella alpina]
MHRLARPRISNCCAGRQAARSTICTSTSARDVSKSSSPANSVQSKEDAEDATSKQTSNATTPPVEPTSVEDLVKRLRLKPSAQVGIRNRLREEQLKQEKEEAARRAAEEDTRTGAEKIHRLFEKLQLGGDSSSVPQSTNANTPNAASASTTRPAANVSDSWKFLFDEDDLKDGKSRATDSAATTVGNETSQAAPPRTDRWKDPKLKSAERDAFKALFSSLFEQKPQSPTSAERVQSMFSNFNRSGHERTADSISPPSISPADPTLSPATSTSEAALSASTTVTEDDPMQVLRRQLQNLSKRVEPIYLDRKPKTSSFQVMESTVGPQDWMNQDPTLPKENSLFAAIRSENQVAIRMRKELEEKRDDIIKVKEFVDELLAPLGQPVGTASSPGMLKPSTVSLDGLMAQAILAASSKHQEQSGSKLEPAKSGDRSATLTSTRKTRSLHPFMGHAFVEHTRRQGLEVFIQTVRKETYKALLRCRWEAWQDGPGCLEILKEMQGNGAAMDAETRQLVNTMVKDLESLAMQAASDPVETREQLQQFGWGNEEQLAPLREMIIIIRGAEEEDRGKGSRRWTRNNTR